MLTLLVIALFACGKACISDKGGFEYFFLWEAWHCCFNSNIDG